MLASIGASADDLATPAATRPVFGHLDPATNVFTPDAANAAAAAADSQAAGAPVVIRSTLVVTVNVNFTSTFPASGTARATVKATSVPAATTNPSFSSGALRTAAITKTGSKGTVSISLPLALSVSSATDTILLTTSIDASTGAYANSTQSIPIPANGTTKTIIVSQQF
ncbi:MAG TPA: hypothetical protein PKA55_15110 [Rhodoblastus sp.]|nr:hypothetical protein [Rhodoblastus sp.]